MTARGIVAALDGRWHGSYGTACCPAHDDRRPSLSISERDGKLLVKCHAGCEQAVVWGALRDGGLLGTSNYEFSPSHVSSNGRALRQMALGRSAHRREGSNTPHARKIWRAAKPAEGTPAQTYLQHRGITIEPPPTIRYHPGLKHGPTGLPLPAMVAAVTMWPGREVVAIHRTFITADGSKKAPVTQNKMMLGPCSGGAVRLGSPGDALMVGEGIETCLAAMQATGRPAWAALSTSGLRALNLPETAREVIVLADGDDPGEAAARETALRWKQEGRSVRIARPPRGADFNDVLLGRARRFEEGAS